MKTNYFLQPNQNNICLPDHLSAKQQSRANVRRTPGASAAMLIPLEPDTPSRPVANMSQKPNTNLPFIHVIKESETVLEPTGEVATCWYLHAGVYEFLIDLHVTETRETVRRSDGLLPVLESSVISRATADRVSPHTRTIIFDLIDGQVMHSFQHSCDLG